MQIKTCVLCNAEYYPNMHNQKYCHECLKYRKREIWREYEHSSRKKKKKRRAVLKARSTPSKSINEIVREIKAYNEKHGTHLTYGKYVEKMALGLLKD